MKVDARAWVCAQRLTFATIAVGIEDDATCVESAAQHHANARLAIRVDGCQAHRVWIGNSGRLVRGFVPACERVHGRLWRVVKVECACRMFNRWMFHHDSLLRWINAKVAQPRIDLFVSQGPMLALGNAAFAARRACRVGG